mgnify:FL=1
MARISRVMMIGWLTLIVGVLAIPQLAAVIPIDWSPYVAASACILTVLIRWLSGGLGVNPLTIVGALTVVAGLAGIPELLAIIPVAAMPYVSMGAAIATLVARFQAGLNPAEVTAVRVGLLRERP